MFGRYVKDTRYDTRSSVGLSVLGDVHLLVITNHLKSDPARNTFAGALVIR